MITASITLKNKSETSFEISEETATVLIEKEIEKLQKKIEELENISEEDFVDKFVAKKIATKLNTKIKNDANFAPKDFYEYDELKSIRGESFSSWIESKGFAHSLVGSANNLRSSAEKIMQTVLRMNSNATIDMQKDEVIISFGKMTPIKDAVIEWIFGDIDAE